jgi:diguanylate cyclase
MNAPADLAAAALLRLRASLAAADPTQLGRVGQRTGQRTGGGLAAGASGSTEAAMVAALQARELAANLGRPLDEARAAVWLCTHLLHQGRNADAMHEALAARPLLLRADQAHDLAAEWRELLRVLALAGSEQGDFNVALEAAHELVRVTASAGDDSLALVAAFALAACFDRMGDSWQAERLLTQALQDHGHGRPDLPLMMATNGVCAITLSIVRRLRGLGVDAELDALLLRGRRAADRALALLHQVPDPVYEVAVLGNSGELLTHQGELAAAEPLLRQALALAQQRTLHAHQWVVQTSLGLWLHLRGEHATAWAQMQTLLQVMGEQPPQQTAIRAHDAAYRACKALGNTSGALAHFEAMAALERRRTTAQLRAQSQLFVTRAEAQHAQWQAEVARRDADVQRQRAADFAESAERDPLTGLGNRRHLDRRCAELLPAAQREQRPISVAQIDIDHFKAINDSHGHAAGDRVLVTLAQLLRDNTRQADVLARHGGEEFVVLLPDMDRAQASEVCERLRERVAARAWGDDDARGGKTFSVTISIGLASSPPYDATALLLRADEALYRAKRSGRNRLETAD